MAGKSTRITVDLGDAELAKSLRIAAVESGRTVRDIVVEALSLWLERTQGQQQSAPRASQGTPHSTEDARDYRSMIETLNKYRGAENR